MSEDAARERYRTLPEPVRPEDTAETTDTNRPPDSSPTEEIDRFLRAVGAG